jgi:hypothetical protein
MKTTIFIVASSVIISSSAFADCDCTITPYKPDPPCFMTCVSKILAHAPYDELTSKYGLSKDVAQKVIDAREKGTDKSTGWYTKTLNSADITHIDAKFKSLNDSGSTKSSMGPTGSTTTTTTTTKPPE